MMFDAEGENEMKLLIDYAGLDEIRRLYEYYPLDGVTTNPAILAAQGEEPYETLKKIRAFIGPEADLHVQVVSPDAEGMLREARSILDCLGQNTCIKVPVLPEGLKAIKRLALDGVRVTATVVFTPMQALRLWLLMSMPLKTPALTEWQWRRPSMRPLRRRESRRRCWRPALKTPIRCSSLSPLVSP